MATHDAILRFLAIDDVSKPARTVATALRQTEGEIKAVAKAMADTGASDNLVKSLAKLHASEKDIEAVAAAWRDYAKASNLAAESSQWTKAQAAQVQQWERQTIAAVRAVTNERRNEARVEAELVRQQRQQVQHAARERREWFKGDKTMAATLGAAALGGGLMEGVHKVVHSAAEAEQLRFRIRELSRGDPGEAENADALVAEIAARYPAISRGKAYDNYIELRANSVDEHGRVDPRIARRNAFAAARAQNAALAIGAEMTPEDMQNLLKGVEGSGRADDPKAVEKISDAYLRAKQVFGSAIASSMIRDYVANAKAANFSVGDDQFYFANMVRMSEGNSSRLGNETAQTLSTLVGGSMKKATGRWLIEHGLADAADMENMGGGAVRFRKGIKESATLQTDQPKWAATTLREAIEKSPALSEKSVEARMKLLRDAELKSNPNAEIDERFLRNRAEEGLISAEIMKSGVRSTVADNLAHLLGNERLIERDTRALQAASGTGASDRIGENPIAALGELKGALDSFAAVLGSPAMMNAGGILHSMAASLADFSNALGEWQKANPGWARTASTGLIAGGLVGGGALMYGALNGFGLGASATALTGSAAALTEAAAALKVGALPGALPGGAPGGPSLGKGNRARAVGGMFSGVWDLLNGPSSDQELADSNNAWNKWFEGTDAGKTLIRLGVAAPAPQMVIQNSGPQTMPNAWTPEHLVPLAGPRSMPNAWEPERPIPVAAPASPAAAAPAAAAAPPDYSAAVSEVDTFGVRLGEATAKAQELQSVASQPMTANLDASSIDAAKTKAEAMHAAVTQPASVPLDSSAIDVAIVKVGQLKAGLASLGAAMAAALPSLGPALRGNFSHGGTQGE